VLAVAVALVPARADSTVQPPAAADRFDLARPEIKTFIDDVSRRHSLKRRDLSKLLAKAQPQPKIIEMMTKPAERVIPLYEYRARFVNDERVTLGVQLWLDHRLELEDIAKARGVPPEYLLAIIGVETKYGRITGRFRVIDALATLAFDYPPRSDFFRKELEEFVLLSREERMDPLKTMGSYAGAMGNAQFMPSSYRKYAVDAQGDRKRDLWTDWGDVFASIANYFREYGWETGAPVLSEVDLDPDPSFVMDTRNLSLNETVASLAAQGVETRTDVPANTPAMLIFAEQSDGPAYRVGFHNFQVITRYNRSPRYAMAVHDLAEAIAARMHEVAPPSPPPATVPVNLTPTATPPSSAQDASAEPAPATQEEVSRLPAATPASPEATPSTPPEPSPAPPQEQSSPPPVAPPSETPSPREFTAPTPPPTTPPDADTPPNSTQVAPLPPVTPPPDSAVTSNDRGSLLRTDTPPRNSAAASNDHQGSPLPAVTPASREAVPTQPAEPPHAPDQATSASAAAVEGKP
jgi:membrane-bound lytic murein transglycosylase B